MGVQWPQKQDSSLYTLRILSAVRVILLNAVRDALHGYLTQADRFEDLSELGNVFS